MSYRERNPSTRQADLKAFDIGKDYRRVFGSDEGRRVLDHIVQRVCGVDAVVEVTSDAQAHAILARKNVGLTIAKLALASAQDETTVEVKT